MAVVVIGAKKPFKGPGASYKPDIPWGLAGLTGRLTSVYGVFVAVERSRDVGREPRMYVITRRYENYATSRLKCLIIAENALYWAVCNSTN